ncbi:MAG: transcriptional regulator [Acidobacteriota bacterium]
MIDALFGSKTRVKLLHLFLNNPGKAFYVREITRLIDEQINSVRRELSNMLEVGIITSKNTDNKLYYEINQRYEFYTPFRAIFANQKIAAASSDTKATAEWQKVAQKLAGARVVIAAGALVSGSASKVDLLIVGDVASKKVAALISAAEAAEARELTYATLTYDEFYYRLSVRDRFISDILTNKHEVLVDMDEIIKQ